MIQRLQSVYLFFAALGAGTLLLLDDPWRLGDTASPPAWFAPSVYVLCALVGLGSLGAIFLYKNREQQRKAVLVLQFITVILIAIVGAGLVLTEAFSPVSDFSPMLVLALIMPAVIYILLWLARRGIEADIKLVKSVDRLRG